MSALLRYWLAFAERIADRLLDPARRERTAAALLVAFALVYALYAVLSFASRDAHFDVGELVAWSRAPALGYNHPPLAAWVAQAWFSVFPLADWAAYLLATGMSALALWIAWRLAGEWLDDAKRVVALAMLTLVPLYSFQALIFNANVVMLPFWAAATLFFLRSYVARDAVAAAFAGLAAAGALLGKYWSIYLIAGLALAALLDGRRARYFASAAPWVSIAAGLAVLAPHLMWLAAGEAPTIAFALGTAGAGGARFKSLAYVWDAAAYVVAPLLIFAALRPGRTALAEVARPAAGARRLIVLAWFIPLALPPLLNLLFPSRLTALWTMPNWTLLPVVLLGSPKLIVTRRFCVRVIAAALALPLLALLAAPLVALVTHHTGAPGYQPHYRQLAGAIERMWRGETQRPLRLVGGEHRLAHGLAFYLADRPTTLAEHLVDPGAGRSEIRLAGPSAARLAREGIVFACPVAESACVSAIEKAAQALGGRRDEVTLARRFLGIAGRPERYLLLAVPPRG